MTIASQNPAKEIRDITVSYGNYLDSLVVVIHASGTPLPGMLQPKLYGQVFIRDASIDAVARALDAVMDGGGKYFPGGIVGIKNMFKTMVDSGGVYFYGLKGASSMSLGGLLPYDFGAKASQIAKHTA